VADQAGISDGFLRTLEPDRALYGALVAASTLVAVGSHVEDYRSVAGATFGAVVIFWLAHVYTRAQTFVADGDAGHVLVRMRAAAANESGVIVGGLPAIVVYLVDVALGLSKENAATVAVWFSVVLLGGVGYLTARRAGVHGGWAVIDAGVAALLGIVVVIGKAALH
jgi:hypothetical protein